MEDVAFTYNEYLEKTLDNVRTQRNQALDDAATNAAELSLTQSELENVRGSFQQLAEDYYSLWEGDLMDSFVDRITELEQFIEVQEYHISNLTNENAELWAQLGDEINTDVPAPPVVELPAPSTEVVIVPTPVEEQFPQPAVVEETPVTPTSPIDAAADVISDSVAVPPVSITLPETSSFPPLTVEISPEPVPLPPALDAISDVIDNTLPTTIDVGDVAQPEPAVQPAIEVVEDVAPLTDNENPLV